jgi:hypothetical protein
MTTTRVPNSLRMPVLSRPVVRDGERPTGPLGSQGLGASAADCSKLRGIARDMCYRAQARRRI